MSYSLRRRAILGSLAWAAVVSTALGILLFRIIDSTVIQRFDQHISEYFLEFAGAISQTQETAEAVFLFFNDLEFMRPGSGHYWQANGPDDAILASRSMFDFVLEPPPNLDPTGEFWNGVSPDGAFRGYTRKITLEDGSLWQLTIAETTDSLDAERRRLRDSLALAFGALSVLAVTTAAFSASRLLRPLDRLRKDVLGRWNSGQRLVPSEYPTEVVPLISDLNEVLDRNTGILERSRRQASDLAHSLNTPAAILRNELGVLAGSGARTGRAADALARIEAQISRSLARMRAENTDPEAKETVGVAESLRRLGKVFNGIARDRQARLQIECEPTLNVVADRQDLEEILGNIIDNALKWCASAVRVRCQGVDRGIGIAVEDDGAGIPEADRMEALRAGGRLDRKSPGTGLGLAIASDLVQAYGGTLSLGKSSDLGGLKVEITLPGQAGTPAA